EKGYIGVTLHQGATSLIIPVVDAVVNAPSEDIAILCKTNSEVLTLYSMLISRGVNAKYITSKDGFSLGQLDELQYVVNLLKEKPLDTVLELFKKYYNHSTNYKLALQVIGRFQNEYLINNEDLSSCYTYFTDYLSEITFEEFEYSKAKVIVSTMHKAKGKEFDSVYLPIKKGFIQNDYDRRLLYVAITRAKHNLHIHTNDHSIKAFKQSFVEKQFVNEI
ncbi:MAG: 3'-5' exonuclease, partial [Sulfurospirillaceae bacterium]|nr:3'-5' exonuclease [Sulfurospirillaceae bacterium]